MPTFKFSKTLIINFLFFIFAVFCLSATFIKTKQENDWSARRALIVLYTKTLAGKQISIESAISELEAIKTEMEARNTLRPNHIFAFNSAIIFLQNSDNQNFKYFEFYQKNLLPLFQILPSDEAIGTSDANKNGIFDPNFLNPLAFAELEKDSLWNDKFELGKLLFHEPLMSGNNKRSCASCHQAEKAFTDGLAKSIDFEGTGTVDRNAPMLINSVFARPYLHDLSHFYLEGQFHQVLEHPKEFRTKYWDIIRKLNFSSAYVGLFQKAFPQHKKITTEGIEVALKTYVASLVALNSDFDKMIRSEMAVNEEVVAGYNIFMGKANCGTCHYPPLFSGLQPPFYIEAEGHAVGVPASAKKPKIADTKDLGAALIPTPEDPNALYKFKTPTLRNLSYSAPYMHNGVFSSLDEAVNFMCSGGNPYKGHPTLLLPVALSDGFSA
jgi:cytochrome c peroxidase